MYNSNDEWSIFDNNRPGHTLSPWDSSIIIQQKLKFECFITCGKLSDYYDI